MTTSTTTHRTIVYADSDRLPKADVSLQFRCFDSLQGGLAALFAADPDVFVAGDLLWYPVEGDPTIRQAPDVLVAFGRPKGERGSYRQWEEGGIAPQVVFEVLSPGNRFGQMLKKFAFYERYGVEEYYIYDPDAGELFGWQRSGERLAEIPRMEGWESPRLKVRFALENGELRLTGPEGRPFADYVELDRQRQEAEQRRREAERKAETLRAQLRAAGIEPAE